MNIKIKISTQWKLIMMVISIVSILGCGMYTKGQPIENGLPPKQALLVLDIQNDFVEPNAKLPVDQNQADIMISNANLLIAAFSSDDAEIVYIGNEFKSSDKIGNWFRKGAAIEGAQGAQLSRRINVIGKAYFPKEHPDAFSNVSFDKYLRERYNRKLWIGLS